LKPRRPTPLDEVTRRVSGTAAAIIDELYGLEPVYEPVGERGESSRATGFTTEFVSVLCPYCWESYESQVDLSAGSFTYVEDCQVCCQPIELSCAVEEGLLVAVKPERMD
jgi:hypothetical protein